MKYYTENGRSMIEMLGVLAIIGVLSIGAIAGYSKAMTQYKINKTIEQISHIFAQARIYYANVSGEQMEGDISVELLKNIGAISDDIPLDNFPGISGHPLGKNVFGGALEIHGTMNYSPREVLILYISHLPHDVCTTLALHDWRSLSSTFVGLEIANYVDGDLAGIFDQCFDGSGGGTYGDEILTACLNDENYPIPLPPSLASKGCNCVENTCEIFIGIEK